MSVPSESLLRHFHACFCCFIFIFIASILGGGVITPILQASSQSQRLVCLRTPSSETRELGSKLGPSWTGRAVVCGKASVCGCCCLLKTHISNSGPRLSLVIPALWRKLGHCHHPGSGPHHHSPSLPIPALSYRAQRTSHLT